MSDYVSIRVQWPFHPRDKCSTIGVTVGKRAGPLQVTQKIARTTEVGPLYFAARLINKVSQKVAVITAPPRNGSLYFVSGCNVVSGVPGTATQEDGFPRLTESNVLRRNAGNLSSTVLCNDQRFARPIVSGMPLCEGFIIQPASVAIEHECGDALEG